MRTFLFILLIALWTGLTALTVLALIDAGGNLAAPITYIKCLIDMVQKMREARK